MLVDGLRPEMQVGWLRVVMCEAQLLQAVCVCVCVLVCVRRSCCKLCVCMYIAAAMCMYVCLMCEAQLLQEPWCSSVCSSEKPGKQVHLGGAIFMLPVIPTGDTKACTPQALLFHSRPQSSKTCSLVPFFPKVRWR